MKDISLPQLGNMIEQNLEESKLWSGPTAKIIKDELIARLR